MEKPEFLKEKYDLHTAPEVAQAAERTRKRTGEKVPQDPAEQIQNYLNRFKEIVERPDPEKRERGMGALKEILHEKFVIKPEDIPEGYFENQRRIAREQGHGDIEVSDEMRRQLADVITTDQRNSLDHWIDYLASSDATYPDWLKYYAFRSVLGMGEYDKEKKQFAKRSRGTTKPFPDIDREALAYVLDAISQKYGKRHLDLLALDEEEKKQFEKLLASENFSKLYAWAIEKLTIAPQESLEQVRGKWVKYPQGSDVAPLVESLRGHGTGWCTAGESTAEIQLKGGDFYVFYSMDRNGKPTVPRVAIRMSGNAIAEVRGVAAQQNLDPYIGPIVAEKLKEFPDGGAYTQKVSDMKALTAIEAKVKEGQELGRSDLALLYELDHEIEGFGYDRDPRIQELRDQRNAFEDAPTVFGCRPEQVARSQEEMNADTKAYIGPLFPGVFKFPLEHIYTKFPEGKIIQHSVELGAYHTAGEYLKALEVKHINVSDWANDMLKKMPVSVGYEQLELVELSVADLGFPDGATRQAVYDHAEKYGLDVVPAQVGPALLLQYPDQRMNSWVLIGMEPIDVGGDPSVFALGRIADGTWLHVSNGHADCFWYSAYRWVFARRK